MGRRILGDKVEAWKSYQGEMHALNERFQRGELAGQPITSNSACDWTSGRAMWEQGENSSQSSSWLDHAAIIRPLTGKAGRSGGAARNRDRRLLSDFATFHNFASSSTRASCAWGHGLHRLPHRLRRHLSSRPLSWSSETKSTRAPGSEEILLYDEVQDNSVSNNRLFRVLCASKTVPYWRWAVGRRKAGNLRISGWPAPMGSGR